MNTRKFHLLLLGVVLLMTSPLYAQGDDSFEDDPFEAQQNSMRRAPRNQGSQWRPSSYADQAAMLESMSKAKIKRNLIYKFETAGMAGSGNHAPFWHTSNRQGLPSANSENAYMHFAALGSMRFPSQFGLGYGMDLGIGANLQSNWFVHQLYIDLDYKWLELSFGMKERWGEGRNHTLSSGALTWSGNSQPIPQIRLEVPDFETIPLLDGWFAFKGHISYGLYTDGKWRKTWAQEIASKPIYADGILHHSKSLFMRVGHEKKFPLSMTFGLEMNTQFGGTIHNIPMGGVTQEEYALPSGIGAYWEALMPFNKRGEQGDENGNSLGSWHLAFDYKFDNWNIRAYYEHYYEDHSSMLGIEYKTDVNGDERFVNYGFKNNWFDGQFGLEINAPEGVPFNNIVLEFLNTRGLCGPVCNLDGILVERVDGRDGMYNHSKYLSYTHWSYANGNPLLLSPIYNTKKGTDTPANGKLNFASNRIRSYHIGVDGSVTPKIDYRVLASYTKHWGTYSSPFEEVRDISSLLLECSYWLGGTYDWKFTLSGAFDIDGATDLIGNNKGVMLTITKLWKVL